MYSRNVLQSVISTVIGGADAVDLELGSATRGARKDACCVRTGASKSGVRRATKRATKVTTKMAAKSAATSRAIRVIQVIEDREVMTSDRMVLLGSNLLISAARGVVTAFCKWSHSHNVRISVVYAYCTILCTDIQIHVQITPTNVVQSQSACVKIIEFLAESCESLKITKIKKTN